MSATRVLFEEEINEHCQEKDMYYNIMYNDWMRDQELERINQLEDADFSTNDIEIDIKFDPDNVLTGEAFDKAIKDCQDRCLEIDKKRKIDDCDKLNRPMSI